MTRSEEGVLRHLEQILQGHRQVLVALSGGLDSTVLLHQLTLLRDAVMPDLQLRAMHVHHGLSPRADSWVTHCETLCFDWQVPLLTVRVTLPAGGAGLEGEARQARYRVLENALLTDEVLMTAQHQDDQCETFLLALKRGSGPAGLAAMPVSLMRGTHLLLRPLLDFRRQDLESWAEHFGLNWIEDESNQDDRYDRNFLRLRVLPVLQQRWPHFSRSVSRSAALCGEQEQLLDELLAEQLTEIMNHEGALAVAPLTLLSDVRRAALLRRWLSYHQAVMPSRASLERIWQEVALSREDANPRMQCGTHDVRRFRGALYWVARKPLPDVRILPWPKPWAPLQVGELGCLSFSDQGMPVRSPVPEEPVTVRFNAGGLLHITGRHKGRSLKKIWQELNIPPWRRERTPLLFYGEQLIAAAGVFVTQEGEAAETGSLRLCLKWQVSD